MSEHEGKGIKTREVKHNIKALDKSAEMAKSMKKALVRTKDQVQNLMDDGQVTPEEYAEDKMRYAAEDTVSEAGEQTKNAAKKTAAKTKSAAKATAAKTKTAAKKTAVKAKNAAKSTAAKTKSAAKATAAKTKQAAKKTASKAKNAAKRATGKNKK